MSVLSIIIGILVIGLIVFVHEFGHFIIARKSGVSVPEFWIGFGPKLISFKLMGTEFSLRPILFGGACIFDEIDPEEDDASAFLTRRIPSEGLLNDQSPWVRLQVLFAGPFFNLLLGFICSMIVIAAAGIDFPVIQSLSEGYPAEEAGLEPGDLITGIDSASIYTFRDLQLYLNDYRGGQPVTIRFERDGEERSVQLTPLYDEEYDAWYIGIRVSGYRDPARSGSQILFYSFHEVGYWIRYTVHALKDLFTGNIPVTSLSGPVGVVSAVSDVVQETSKAGAGLVLLNLANIIAILTVDIGVMNLLPVPGLDGGRILLVLVELIRGKRLPEKGEYAVTLAGIALLLLLMIFVFFKDIMQAAGLF